MSQSWIIGKIPEFVRDLFRDFCEASLLLEEQFTSFDKDGTVSFEQLKDLTGQEMDKGLLWRLKDTAHHVFRNDPDDSVVGQFLDWAMGYIFHETIKLKEDAYQKQNYAPWFHKMLKSELPESERRIAEELMLVLSQTEESMHREIERIRFIMAKCRQLLPYYLERHRENALLARVIFAKNDMVREVFADEYDELLQTVYGEGPELMPVLASRSLRIGGWIEDAQKALDQAASLNKDSKLVLQEGEKLGNYAKRMKM